MSIDLDSPLRRIRAQVDELWGGKGAEGPDRQHRSAPRTAKSVRKKQGSGRGMHPKPPAPRVPHFARKRETSFYGGGFHCLVSTSMEPPRETWVFTHHVFFFVAIQRLFAPSLESSGRCLRKPLLRVSNLLRGFLFSARLIQAMEALDTKGYSVADFDTHSSKTPLHQV